MLVSHTSQYFSNLPTGRHALFQLRFIRLKNVVWNSTDSRHLWISSNPAAALARSLPLLSAKTEKGDDLMTIDLSLLGSVSSHRH
jgi:hypothetical protein